ncbi:hypothetical protein [Xylella fastidiosa]|uniref:hypothetical protein n=1 Tax=Xylella fastidiosa TaxID=2371 RepID=UPI001190B83A|nr:hypothetical protein [Xylella fastidiosa]MBS9446091.1 hypothetical protein [Xylella fastidiosa subsp. multiplex]MBS9448048.1 hypothetical protein [Xylella fastidiosa subsp. multiplex]MBS9450071.1 hypothetical protein [Xylella fastidiosa subsp. multiplex]MBS9452024.1 hypothetical protein [Xylella fastidiosa subsp. multiplex]MBS9486486.1 hypothetical protein [Xylella fastidiosa subsp. multiplex]
MTDFKDREPALLRLSKGAMREWYGLILGWLLVMAVGGCLLWNVARARGLLPRGDSMMLLVGIVIVCLSVLGAVLWYCRRSLLQALFLPRLPPDWIRASLCIQTALPSLAHASHSVLACHDASWERFCGGLLIAEDLNPATAQCAPWETLDAQACINRLEQLRESWQQASQRRIQQQQRRYWLEMVLVLIDHGVSRPLHDGSLPDVLMLRTECLLLGVDQGPLVLNDVPGVFARRLWLALQVLPEVQRKQAHMQWSLLHLLHDLGREVKALDALAQLVLVLAWNPEMDLDQVEVAYAQAAEYRKRICDWLVRAAQVIVSEDSQVRLDKYLLLLCPLLSSLGGDDIGYVEALRPLHTGFTRLYESRLRTLVTLADEVEQQLGLRLLSAPSSAVQSVAQDSPLLDQ